MSDKPTNAALTADEASAAEELFGTVAGIQQAIEAILFAAGYPVPYEKLSEVIGLPPHHVRDLVADMAHNYEGRGIQLLLYPDTCQLCTKEVFAPYIREALGIKRGGNLSASSLEVMAVVAYNQPVTRSFIDTVRGVDSSYAVSSLLDKNLIEACGRLEAPGRPMLYRTTDKFLRVFGLKSLADLPETEALHVAEAAEQQKAEAAEAESQAEAEAAIQAETSALAGEAADDAKPDNPGVAEPDEARGGVSPEDAAGGDAPEKEATP